MRPLLLISCVLLTVSAIAQTNVGPALQKGDPVQITESHHGEKDALLGAVFLNRSDKSILSYRIGWAVMKDGKTTLQEGTSVSIPGGAAAGAAVEVPDQQVLLDRSARVFMFYVSEVTYTDGTTWSAEAAPLITQAQSWVTPEFWRR